MTLDSPASTAAFTISAPSSIIQKPVHAQRGVARRAFRSIAEAKYRTAISKKMIQTINTSIPWAVSAR